MANTRDFLFELGVEEMPSAPLNNAVKQLESLMGKGLDEAGLAHGAIRVISSPRRYTSSSWVSKSTKYSAVSYTHLTLPTKA